MVTVVADNAPPIARDDNYQGTIGELLQRTCARRDDQ